MSFTPSAEEGMSLHWIRVNHRIRLTAILTAYVAIALGVVFSVVFFVVRQQSLSAKFADLSQSVSVVAHEWTVDHSIREEQEDFPSLSFSVYGLDGTLKVSSSKVPLPLVSGQAKLKHRLLVSKPAGDAIVVGSVSWLDTENGLRQLALVLAVLWLPLSILTAVVTWLGGGLVIKPIRELLDSANRLSGASDGGFLTTTDQAEFAELAESLNQLIGRVRYSGELQEQFAADAAHELRSPLALMRTRIETTLLRERQPSEYADSLRTMLVTVERMTALVETLLLSARQAGASAQTIDLSITAKNVIDEWNAEPQEILRFEQDLEPASARFSEDELRIVLRNILENALRYATVGTPILVKLKASGEFAELTVENRGPELSDQDRLAAFDRFYRVDKARSPEAGRVGIGLAVVKKIVQSYDGNVEFLPTVGGACIRIRVPLAAE